MTTEAARRRIPAEALATLLQVTGMEAQRVAGLRANIEEYRDERDSLASYLPAVHRTDDSPPQPATPPEHVRAFIEAIEDDSLGNTVIIAPPGSAKTLTCIAGAGWRLGRNPNLHIGYLSNTGPQASARSVAVRDTISSSPDYRAIFPDAEPDRAKSWTEARWFLWRADRGDKDPSMLAAGTGGPIQGARMDLIFLDDIADPENMATPYQREKVVAWLNNVVKTRLTPQGRMIMICTRWHVEDPAGWAIKEGWRVIRVKAVQEDAATGSKSSYWPKRWPLYRIDCTAAGAEAHGLGDPSWEPSDGRPEPPCWVERDALGNVTALGRCMRSGMSQREYNLVYQGDTTDDSAALFKRSYWRYLPRGEQFAASRGALFVDLAHEEKSENDFTSIARWLAGTVDRLPAYYISHMIKRRFEFPEVVALLRGLVKPGLKPEEWSRNTDVLTILRSLGRNLPSDPAPFPNMSVVIEKTPGSAALIQTLRRELPGVIAWTIRSRFGGSKLGRANSVVHLAEARNLWLPEGAIWTGDFIEEHASFPNGVHDDQVDTTTMALLRFTGGGVLQTTS